MNHVDRKRGGGLYLEVIRGIWQGPSSWSRNTKFHSLQIVARSDDVLLLSRVLQICEFTPMDKS